MIQVQEPVSATSKKTIKTLHLGCMLIFATIVGIWSFAVKRFDYDESLFIILAGAVVGIGISLIMQTMIDLIEDKSKSKVRPIQITKDDYC